MRHRLKLLGFIALLFNLVSPPVIAEDNCETKLDSTLKHLTSNCIEFDGQTYQAKWIVTDSGLFELQMSTVSVVSTPRLGVKGKLDKDSLNVDLPSVRIGNKFHKAKLDFVGKASNGNLLFSGIPLSELDSNTGFGRLIIQLGQTAPISRKGKPANTGKKDNPACSKPGAANVPFCNESSDEGEIISTSDEDEITSASDKGKPQPGTITAAILDVKEVVICGAANGCQSVGEAREVDLYALMTGQGGETLANISLPAERFNQLRLVLDSNSYVIADGEKHKLTVPSGEQTGLKIKGDWEIVGGQITHMQLDMNVADIRWNRGTGYRVRPTAKVVNVVVTDNPTDIEFPIETNDKTTIPNTIPIILTVGDQIMGLRFSLPIGAYSGSEKLSGEVSGVGRISPIYRMNPDGAQFTKNATITIPYDETKIPEEYSEENIVILRDGIAIPSIVNTLDNTVSAETNHFSSYTAALAHNCIFTDIDYNNADLEWASTAIHELCKNVVVQGYPSGNGTWEYKPWQKANVFETLKILLSTKPANCRRYNDDDNVVHVIADAENLLYTKISEETLYQPITREKAINYLANIHYGYFESNAIDEMKKIGVTTGERPSDNISRAELARLAYLSSKLIQSDGVKQMCDSNDSIKMRNDDSLNLCNMYGMRLENPLNGVTIPHKAKIRFKWSPWSYASNATYRFHLSRYNDESDFDELTRTCVKKGCWTGTTRNTHLDFNGFGAGGNANYYWRVRSSINGNWSKWNQFKTSDGSIIGQAAKLVDSFPAQGGPKIHKPQPDDPVGGGWPTTAGTYTIAHCGVYPRMKSDESPDSTPESIFYSSWLYSRIRWDSRLNDLSTSSGTKLFVRQKTETGLDYYLNSFPIEESVSSIDKVCSACTNQQVRDHFISKNKLPNTTIYSFSWAENDFGHYTCYYKNSSGTLQIQYIHPTPTLEKNPNSPLGQSHGCIHVRPDDLDYMMNKGYLIGGSKFIVHSYDEAFDSNNIVMGATGSHEYELHFYPGEDITNYTNSKGKNVTEWSGNIYVITRN